MKGALMRYKVIDIYDEDYGCEGVPEDSEPMCIVVLCDDSGNEKQIKLSDNYLRENSIDIGSYIEA